VISAVVLAAGSATRFGATKQLEIIRDKPLPQHAIDAALAAGVDEIVVVLGHEADLVAAALRLPEIARVVRNPAYASGPGPALLAREAWSEAEALEGDAGARVLAERHPAWVEEVDVGGQAPVDVDVPEDLRRA
jgi:CTP:molybdopterin cytidylyltransferase MocA